VGSRGRFGDGRGASLVLDDVGLDITTELGRIPVRGSQQNQRVIGADLAEVDAAHGGELAYGGGDLGCGVAGEQVRDGPVEVQEQDPGAAEQLGELGAGAGREGHCGYSRVMVVHTESNQVRAWATYWGPLLVSASSPVEKWNRVASLPIGSKIGTGALSMVTVCSRTG